MARGLQDADGLGGGVDGDRDGGLVVHGSHRVHDGVDLGGGGGARAADGRANRAASRAAGAATTAVRMGSTRAKRSFWVAAASV